jgi:predicted CopG family antitoxin
MEMTTIKVSKKLATELNKLKYYYGDKSINDVIERLYKGRGLKPAQKSNES